jgi:subtilase family serine protease
MTMTIRWLGRACAISAFGFSAVTASAATVTTSLAEAAPSAVPYPSKSTPAPRLAGEASELYGAQPISLTLMLKLTDEAGAQAYLQSLYTKGSANYRQFLTPAQFRAKFAQSDESVAAVAKSLATYGLTATRSGASTLSVTGSAAAVENAFHVSLQVYEVAASGARPAYHYQQPTTAAKVPAEVGASVSGVLGLSTRPKFVPHNVRAFDKKVTLKSSGSAAGTSYDQPGLWTVSDFSKYYDVTPLTEKNVIGKGRTIGIVTFANLTVSDPYAYWAAVGLNVAKNRVKVVAVDGGAGPPSDAAGSGETTLDVEQSGGVAPGADIIVYQAPNTSQAFVDAFVRAVEDDKADSISVSWGAWEWFDDLYFSPVTDPFTGETVSEIRANTEVFLQAALQGQTLFAAAGDAGAYDANDGNLPPDYSLALSVDDPAANPYITAGGGTTLPGTQIYEINATGQLVTVNIPHERVWSWDYLVPLCDDLGYDPIDCGIFPVGGGGGVSFEYPLPFYQVGLAGIQKTQPDQQFIDEDTIPPTTLLTLPAHYAGRNVPDISFNADPDTGYVIYYTSDVNGFEIQTFYGGTSFVAPQLNGVTALLGQYLGGRIGLLNVPLYELAKASGAYTGKSAPFNAIKYGNNDYYVGANGYSPAAGIGTLDVFHFAEALKKIAY